jgi:hypothetical protein
MGGDEAVDNSLLRSFDSEVEKARHQLRGDHPNGNFRLGGFCPLVPGVRGNSAVAVGEGKHEISAILFPGTSHPGYGQCRALGKSSALVRKKRRIRRDDHHD